LALLNLGSDRNSGTSWGLLGSGLRLGDRVHNLLNGRAAWFKLALDLLGKLISGDSRSDLSFGLSFSVSLSDSQELELVLSLELLDASEAGGLLLESTGLSNDGDDKGSGWNKNNR